MDNFFKQQIGIPDNMTEKEVIQSIAIGVSAIPKLYLKKDVEDSVSLWKTLDLIYFCLRLSPRISPADEPEVCISEL